MVDSLNSSFCFHLVDFSPEFDYFLLSTSLGCICFFLEALRAMSFLLRNAFIVSHKFGYVVASFSLNSEKALIFFVYSFFDQGIIGKSVVHFP